MLVGYEKLRIPDETKKHELLLEVNWNPYDETSKDGKLIRITMGGKSAIIKREHLNAVLFAIGTAEDQRKMIPQVQRTSRWYETVVSVKATKNIAKGEEITFPIKLTLPTIEKEIIAEAKRDLLETGKLRN